MTEKTFSYQQITTETEAFIRDEMDTLRKIMASDPFDARIERHRATSAGAYYLWLRLTAGFQREGDNARLLAVTFPELQS
ncbi:hypothetical protein FYE33_17085 [Salmonella enterica]|nr:hypothetical protein [Salmonella enterica]EEP3372999.1 hypothetical protein [Salmonella enterica]EFP6579706.1 hypothetical protein [Salmonella enterica]EGC7970989.1 hypothetical protein [Salmonella enterica]